MKIKMFTLMAGPQGVRKPGEVYTVPDEEGRALIAGGYAESVKAEPVKSASEQDEQENSAVVETPEPEKATRKVGRKAVKAADE